MDDFIVGLLYVRARLVYKTNNENESCSLIDSLPQEDAEMKESKGGLSLKWEIANLMRMIEGCFAIVVSFIFIVQSANVLDLFLNFVAVEFVSAMDDAAFFLAKKSFFGNTLKQHADRVSDVHVVDTTIARHTLFQITSKQSEVSNIVMRKKSKLKKARIFSFAAVTFILWGGLTYFVVKQKSFSLVCQSFTLAFDDSVLYYMRYYSGTYELYQSLTFDQ